MSGRTNHLNHSSYECLYHVVFTPKYRKKNLYVQLRRDLIEVLRGLARQKECEIIEGHMVIDHVHILLSIPPKHAVSKVVGFMKGKSAIWIAQTVSNRQRNFAGHKFWARGYYVSTVGADKDIIAAYVRNQDAEDKRQEQLSLFNR